MFLDLDRLTKREAYEAGIAEGLAQAATAKATKPGWLSSEFTFTLMTTLYAMWVGYRLIVDPNLDLERGGAVIAAVLGAAWYYTRSRTETKAAALEASTTTFRTPGKGTPTRDAA